MTGETDVDRPGVQPDEPGLGPADAMVLIDDWPDGMIEERAWVEVTSEVASAEQAVEYLERFYPSGDLEDGWSYTCEGRQEWHTLDREWQEKHGGDDSDPPEGPWRQVVDPTKEDAPDAKLFWVVEVTEPE